MLLAVRQIYSNVVSSLAKYPERRYVSAENIFFSHWWFEQQHFAIRTKVKELVDEGEWRSRKVARCKVSYV